MNFALKRNELLHGLEQVRSRVRQLEAELEQCQAQEQRLVGAIMLCEEGLAAQAKEDQAKEDEEEPGDGAEG